MSAATRSRTPDRLCADAVELAQQAAAEVASPRPVGSHLRVEADDDRVVTHYFESRDPGYRGWCWRVTVARAARARYVTVDEVTLGPGEGALLAPEWLPWQERLRPGDLGPGDLLPATPDDPRLAPGWSGDDEPPPNAPAVDQVTGGGTEADAATGPRAADQVTDTSEGRTSDADGDDSGGGGGGQADGLSVAVEAPAGLEARDVAADRTEPAPARSATDRGAIAAVAQELGRGRRRVLSRLGLREAAERWEDTLGPRTAMAEAAPADCGSCGFLVPMTGSLSQEFGICANEFAPADGRVVSLSFGCGAHSEAARMPDSPQPPPPVIDHFGADPL